MFNILFIIILPIILIEFYKIISWYKYKNLLYFKKTKNNFTYNFLSVYILYFVNNINSFHNNIYLYTISIYFIVLIFNFFFKKHYYNLFFFLVFLITNIMYIQNNLSYFILFVELLTLVLFFFLFLDFYKNNNKYKLNIIIFFLNNFIVFLVGIFFITFLYTKYGTSNVSLLLIFLENDLLLKVSLYFFFFIKLQQCFIFLLNLKYYSISTPKNIFLYKIPYFAIIWVYIFFIFTNFKLITMYNIFLVILHSSFFLFSFLNYFNKWNDFFIFSTWLLLTLQIFYIIL